MAASTDGTLVVKATSYDCARGLHSFVRWKPRGQSYRSEGCRACGAKLVDWRRLDRHDTGDIEYTVLSLQQELIRREFWTKPLDGKAINHAKGKGLVGLREATAHRLRRYLGRPRSELSRDGMQTPFAGNVIFYAQHATATCCRKCVEAWHGVDREEPLTAEVVGYMTDLVMYYVGRRLQTYFSR
ncbi:MAG: DUF4186 family protein [Chloroflexi bacterium]|nr:DUF4186 family protein [Chloroflexota bacterium]